MKTARLLVLGLGLLALSACGIGKEYLKADKATFDAIVPEYIQLVNEAKKADGTDWFTKDEKERRTRTIETWKLRIEKAGD